jgi:hypothetical protein
MSQQKKVTQLLRQGPSAPFSSSPLRYQDPIEIQGIILL